MALNRATVIFPSIYDPVVQLVDEIGSISYNEWWNTPKNAKTVTGAVFVQDVPDERQNRPILSFVCHRLKFGLAVTGGGGSGESNRFSQTGWLLGAL